MSDFKFSCPHCGQHISCDFQWGGHRIPCPACQNELVVPKPEPQPMAPAVPSTLRVASREGSSGAAAPAATRAPSPPSPPPQAPAPPLAGPDRPRPLSPPVRTATPGGDEPRGKARAIIAVAATVVGLGVVLYFVFPMLNSAQKKLNAAREESARESDGGEMGHIATLNRVLNETDPARFGQKPSKEEKRLMVRGQMAGALETANVAPTWTLDVDAAQIPSGRVSGLVSGKNFLGKDAHVDVEGAGYTLTIGQEEGLPADREVVVFLRLAPNESLQGKRVQVSKETRAGVPTVAKRAKPDAQSQAELKSFTGGYAMKLEFGQASAGTIPGQIFLALPDAEHSVVAGHFLADIRVAGASPPSPRRGRRSAPSPDE